MNRKDYTKPTMKVVMLRHAGMLMGSEGLNSTRDNYGNGNKGMSPDETDSQGRWVWDN